MKRLLVVAFAVASMVGGRAAPVSAGLTACYTRGDFPTTAGQWTGAWTQCGSGNSYTYVWTRVRCSNGFTYQGNRIGPSWLNSSGNLATSEVHCPIGLIAMSWYIAYA